MSEDKDKDYMSVGQVIENLQNQDTNLPLFIMVDNDSFCSIDCIYTLSDIDPNYAYGVIMEIKPVLNDGKRGRKG